MKLKANAKINLSLDLTGILPDGYHAINTIMQSVSLFDTVEIKLRTDGKINLGCSDENVPTDGKNTAYKAAEYFFENINSVNGADIFIEKNIPSQAGLAGGSANAAAVLYALNNICEEKLSEKELFEIALKVGADVPFCLAGGTRLCLVKGEKMTALPPFEAYVLLAKPEKGVSTKEAFRRFDTADFLVHPDNEKVLEYYRNAEGEKAAEYSLNLFEQLTDVPERDILKKAMLDNGAYYSSMSGSGSCFFGLFRDEKTAAAAENELKKLVPFTRVCKTVKTGVEEIKG